MTNKLKYFIGNWKMFGDFSSYKIIHKINRYIYKLKGSKNSKIVLCVPSTLIHSFRKKLKRKAICIGAQNCYHQEGYGPFTGAVSSGMLKKMGAEYIILGHSENRSEGETAQLIKKKIISALNQKLNIIFCIGETYKDKERGRTFSVIRNPQLLAEIDNELAAKELYKKAQVAAVNQQTQIDWDAIQLEEANRSEKINNFSEIITSMEISRVC